VAKKRLTQYDVFALPLKTIYCDSDFNCRGQFTVESVFDLAESIKTKGLDFPIVVQPAAEADQGLPPGYDYRLLAGHRRYRAVEFFLQWETIPAMLRTGLTDYQARLLNFTENLERKDLNMLQEAVALQRLYPDGVSLRQAHKDLNRPTKWVAARLRLLDLAPEIQEQAAAGLLSAVMIERLYKETPEEQILIAKVVADAKAKGVSRKMPALPEAYKRRFKYRRTKEEISDMIVKMFDAGVNGLATRALAWSMGEVSDEDFEKDIRCENQREPDYDSLSGGKDEDTTDT